MGQIRFGLGAVDGGIGGGIDDNIGIGARDDRGASGGIGQIGAVAAKAGDGDIRTGLLRQGARHLTCPAKDQHPHHALVPSRVPTP
jgi:hypothetical protein